MFYNQARPLIRSGDILLFKGTSLFGLLIRWATKSPYCHVALARWDTDTGRLLVYQSIEGKGVQCVPASMAIGRETVVILRPLPYHPCAAAQMWVTALDNLGDEYSWGSILKIAWRILLGRLNLKASQPFEEREGQFICSEYAAKCLAAAGYNVPWDGLGFIAPSDFGVDPGLTQVVTIN